MRFGENFEKLKAIVSSYATDKAEQNRGGQKDAYVSASNAVSTRTRIRKTWARSEKDRLVTTGMSEHFAKKCRRKRKGKEKMAKGLGNKGMVKSEGYKGGQSGDSARPFRLIFLHAIRLDFGAQNL